MGDFNFTLGSRWQSKGAGVGTCDHIDRNGDARLRFPDGDSWFYSPDCSEGTKPKEIPEAYWLFGPADDDRQGKLDADGWITWSGGKCPVGLSTVCDLKLRDGTILYTQEDAATAIWFHTGSSGDITAYRLSKPSADASPASTDQGERAFWDEAFLRMAQGWASNPDVDRSPKELAEAAAKYADALTETRNVLAARRERIARTGEQS